MLDTITYMSGIYDVDNELDEETKGQLTDEQLREVKNLVKAHKDPVKHVEEEQEK